MRTQTLIDGFKNSQKIRVIVDGVGFYTTVAGTSDIVTHRHRVAVQTALMNLAYNRGMAKSTRRDTPVGFGFNYNYTADGVEQVTVPVQVDLV